MTNEQRKLLDLYRQLGFLTAKIDSVKRQIAYIEKTAVPTAPSDETDAVEDMGGEGQ